MMIIMQIMKNDNDAIELDEINRIFDFNIVLLLVLYEITRTRAFSTSSAIVSSNDVEYCVLCWYWISTN